MGQIKTDADQAYRDFITDGVPASGVHEPEKTDIRAVFALVDALVGEAGIRWTFDTDTDTASDPGTGDLRFDNATLANVTEIGISDNSSITGNPSVAAWLATWDDSTSTIKGHIFIKKVAAAQNYALYEVTAGTDATTHWRFTVTHVASSGSFSDGDLLAGLFVPKGDKGATGAAGGVTVLDDLTDVDLTSVAPVDGDILVYQTSPGVWVPEAPSSGTPSVHDRGTITTGTETPEWADGEMQKAVNNGAHTLAAMTAVGYYVLTYTNGASAGPITATGWDVVFDDTSPAVLNHTVEGSIIECAAYNDGVSKRLIVTLIEDAT